MRLTYISSACVVVEHCGVKVLCDPWLIDGAYGGAWYHNPPLTVTPEDFHDCQLCYLSHLHPDHTDWKTLERLNRQTTIVVASYDEALRKPLALRLRGMGYTVIELARDQRYEVGPGFTVQVIPADDCNPEACGAFFGCAMKAAPGTTMQIDSLAVFHADGQTIVNVNDLPFGLSGHAIERVKANYPSIDLLCVGYAGAGPYPQCFSNLTTDEKRAAADRKKQQFIGQMQSFVEALKPNRFLPFAGQYTLGGSLVDLNDFRGVPELEDLDHWPDPRMVRLNRGSWFDCETGETSDEWRRSDPIARLAYRESLRAKVLDHERDPWPDKGVFDDTFSRAVEAWRRRMSRMDLVPSTTVTYEAVYPDCVFLGWAWRAATSSRLSISMDARLLMRILLRHENMNNVEVGSLAQFQRTPDVYDRSLFHALAFFHV